MPVLNEVIFYSENAGLFDLNFTDLDITQCIIIFLGASLRAWYEIKKEESENPDVIDIVFMYVIAYFVCGLVWFGIIYKNLEPTLGAIINGVISIQALSIFKWTQDEKTQKMIKETLTGIFPILKKMINKWTS